MKFVSKQVLVDDGGYGDFSEKDVQQQAAPTTKATNQWSGAMGDRAPVSHIAARYCAAGGDASSATSTAADDDDGTELAPAGEDGLRLLHPG